MDSIQKQALDRTLPGQVEGMTSAPAEDGDSGWGALFSACWAGVRGDVNTWTRITNNIAASVGARPDHPDVRYAHVELLDERFRAYSIQSQGVLSHGHRLYARQADLYRFIEISLPSDMYEKTIRFADLAAAGETSFPSGVTWLSSVTKFLQTPSVSTAPPEEAALLVSQRTIDPRHKQYFCSQFVAHALAAGGILSQQESLDLVVPNTLYFLIKEVAKNPPPHVVFSIIQSNQEFTDACFDSYYKPDDGDDDGDNY